MSLVREDRPTAATPPRPAIANDITRSPAVAPASVGALAPVLTVDEVAALLRVERKTVYAAKRKDGLAAKTINNHLTVLRKLLVVARDWGRVRMVPAIQWLRVSAPEFRFLTFEEADRLLASADPEWRAMIALGLKAGLRHGELLALRWSDVDLEVGRLSVRRNLCEGHIGTPRGGRGRDIPPAPTPVPCPPGIDHDCTKAALGRSTGGAMT